MFQGLSQEGIYRLSGVKSKIEMLKELYNQGKLIIQTCSVSCLYFKILTQERFQFESKIINFSFIFVTGKNADLDEFEPNILAGLIKLFIRELTDSILPEEIAQRFEEAAGLCSTK